MPEIPFTTLSFPAGDDILLQFQVHDAAGAPSNITPDAIIFSVGKDRDAPEISSAVSPATALVVKTTPTSGIYQVLIAGEATQALRGTYPWASELEDANGAKGTVHQGVITFSKDYV